MGITTPLFPDENTSSGRDVGTDAYDPVPDPEDDGVDVVAFANFMRATKAPARGPITAEVQAGEAVFNRIGCAICHVASITTAPAGHAHQRRRVRRAGKALGNKIIHPYSDFLLHDIGTGDGIPILPTAEFAGPRTGSDRAAVGAAHAQSADARRPVVHQGGGHRAACRAGGSRCRTSRR